MKHELTIRNLEKFCRFHGFTATIKRRRDQEIRVELTDLAAVPGLEVHS